MAEAPGHRLGQIIGETLELAVGPVLADFAGKHGIYLDKHGPRPARSGKKVTWTDALNNKHDLDFVLERGGTDHKIGRPVAFIETAWRRYTKHSRNKAQEIQGAVLPLVAAHSRTKPFAGVVLAGVFTKGSLAQLESNGFGVLYAPYETIVAVFAQFGMDVDYDEDTPDEYLSTQTRVYDELDEAKRAALGQALRVAVKSEVDEFIAKLSAAILRKISTISVLPLYGKQTDYSSVGDAIRFLEMYVADQPVGELVRFEVIVRYDNDDRIVAEFSTVEAAVDFLRTFAPSSAGA
jgi:hypothetical protein